MSKKEVRDDSFGIRLKSNNELMLGARSFSMMLLYGLLIAGLYYQAVAQMTESWNRDEYNYAYLMPIVVLYLIWKNRASLVSFPSLSSWKGIIPILIGIALFWLGELGGEYFTLYISLWLVLVGLCWIHLGWKKMKTIAFPLFMIVTMFPLPNFIYNKISVKLQLISSQLGVIFLQAFNLPAYREGNVIELAFTQLQVVEACSGLKTLISLVVLGLLLLYFSKTAFWKRALLMISTVPIAILTNSARIAVTGVLYEIWGAEVAEGFFHTFSGILIFLFSLCLLVLELWILKWLPPRESKIPPETEKGQSPYQADEHFTVLGGSSAIAPQENSFSMSGSEYPKSKSRRSLLSITRPPQFIVTVVLLSATFFLSRGVDFRERIPIKRSLGEFPLQVREWSGTRQTMGQYFIEALDFSDYVIIDYENRLGKQVNFYVAYYESQRKGESIHSPSSCLPGSGWIFREAGATTIPVPGSGKGFIQVNRAFMEKSGAKQLSYYWFPQRGRILTNLYESKIFTFWDALTKQRTDGALVRLITPISESEEVKDADERLQNFTQQIVPVLSKFLPQ